ncbi:hypothetical protein OFB61_23925, partial [Escherichia coli]|nr:hypothetical protein [Escherichia coli]
KPSSTIKKTPALKALKATAPLNKLEGEIITEVIIFNTGLTSSFYNNALIKLITFEKIRNYLLKEI